MDIEAMHKLFRELGQQMGLQNVRAIIPEEIDILLNTSISDYVNNIIQTNVNNVTDKVTGDNAKVSQINALHTLYKRIDLNLCRDNTFTELYLELLESDKHLGIMNKCIADLPNYLFIVDFAINYINSEIGFIPSYEEEGYYLLDLDKDGNVLNRSYFFYTKLKNAEVYDVSEVTGITELLTFDEASGWLYDTNTNKVLTIDEDGHWALKSPHPDNVRVIKYLKNLIREVCVVSGDYTRWFPVRIINDADIAKTLNDSCIKPKLATPIITISNNDNFVNLYIDKFKQVGVSNAFTLKGGLIPYKLRMQYIAKPATVHFSSTPTECVDCDLPEFTHVTIVKNAVDLFIKAINKEKFKDNTINPYSNQ